MDIFLKNWIEKNKSNLSSFCFKKNQKKKEVLVKFSLKYFEESSLKNIFFNEFGYVLNKSKHIFGSVWVSIKLEDIEKKKTLKVLGFR